MGYVEEDLLTRFGAKTSLKSEPKLLIGVIMSDLFDLRRDFNKFFYKNQLLTFLVELQSLREIFYSIKKLFDEFYALFRLTPCDPFCRISKPI